MFDAAVADLAAYPEDEDFQAQVRAQVRKVLTADAGLAAEVAQWLSANGGVVASGQGAVAVETNSGVISTGVNATIHR